MLNIDQQLNIKLYITEIILNLRFVLFVQYHAIRIFVHMTRYESLNIKN